MRVSPIYAYGMVTSRVFDINIHVYMNPSLVDDCIVSLYTGRYKMFLI